MAEHKCVNIILIETSTSLCSVALSQDGVIKSYRESAQTKAHASLTAPFVKEVLDECGLSIRECDAVCVSSGPGSYTGLRVGVSTAKGLCFGAGIPLLAVSTMDVLAEMGKDIECRFIVPMIDARRMEVYSAVYANSPAGRPHQISPIEPIVVDEHSFADRLAEGKVLFIGDGAEKCRALLTCDNAIFEQCCPSASAMARLAQKLFDEGKTEDVAYFEPFYLKDFIATVSKKKLF